MPDISLWGPTCRPDSHHAPAMWPHPTSVLSGGQRPLPMHCPLPPSSLCPPSGLSKRSMCPVLTHWRAHPAGPLESERSLCVSVCTGVTTTCMGWGGGQCRPSTYWCVCVHAHKCELVGEHACGPCACVGVPRNPGGGAVGRHKGSESVLGGVGGPHAAKKESLHCGWVCRGVSEERASVHRACESVQPWGGTAGGDVPAGQGRCCLRRWVPQGTGSQPSLPASTSPHSRDPQNPLGLLSGFTAQLVPPVPSRALWRLGVPRWH